MPINDPVLYYTMDDADISGSTITDIGSGGNNGTFENSPTTGVIGRINQAINLNGTNQDITFGDIGLSTGKFAFSVACWVYPTALANGPDYHSQKQIINIGHDGIFLSEDNSQAWSFGFFGSDLNYYGTGSNTAYLINTWTHLVGTYDGATVTLYVNGSAVSTGSASVSNLFQSNKNGYIGQAGDSSRFFQGNIDDVRVYGRSLSSSEVTDLYNYGSSTFAAFQSAGIFAW